MSYITSKRKTRKGRKKSQKPEYRHHQKLIFYR